MTFPDDENEENDDVFGTNNPYIEMKREVEKNYYLPIYNEVTLYP